MECMWATIALIPKSIGEYHIIGLVEVLWKFVIINIYRCLSDSNELNDVLQGFRAWISTGMAKLGAKILQQIEGMRKVVLYDIFVYIHKVYDALD